MAIGSVARTGMVGVLRSGVIAALALLAVGCASVSDPPRETTAPEHRADRPTMPEWEPDDRTRAIRHVLAAEIAVQRGQFAEGLEHYSEAMQLTRDPRVAERSVQLAVLMDDRTRAEGAAERWRDLAPDHPEAYQLLGVLALRRGDVDAAYQHFSQFLERWHGAAADAFSQIGLLLRSGVDDDAAVDTLERLAADHADVAEASRVLGRVAYEAGRYEESLAAADRALALQPGDRDAQMIAIRALIADDRPREAADRVEALVEDGRAGQALRRALGQLLYQAGDDRRALEVFRDFLDDHPDDPDVLHAAGVLAAERGDLDDARRWFTRLLELKEREDEAHLRLARIAEVEDDLETALHHYGETGGEYAIDAALRRALILGEKERIDEGVEELDHLLEQYPEEQARIAAIQGHLLRMAHRLEEALEAYSAGLRAAPEDRDLLYGRGLIRAETGDVDGAEADLRRVLEQAPDDPNTQNALGYTLADADRNLDEARSLIESALEQLPDNPAVLDSMGWILYRQGELEAALSYLERAFDKAPDAEIGAHLGEVLWELGRADEAREVWEQAREIDPDHPVLRRTLERYEP